ncbi:MAG TPA: FAD-binding oxidoreductase, partial [Paracoccaceae bacterium]|nr:FAD-binding oxidoreductase [Paracoccaceae bacterium]
MRLNPLDSDTLARLENLLGKGGLLGAEPRYLSEPRDLYHGNAAAVARPRTVEEVAAILSLCNESHHPVVPFGGGTGLVGGQVSSGSPAPLIVSLERMNSVRRVDPQDNILVAEAGVTLSEAREAADAVNRLFPLSLASEGSCCIGGNLATNAGGVNVLRYGNARDLCLGVEAVLPSGEILRGLKGLRK